MVLDAQLLLTRESPAGEGLRRRLAGCDGSETVVLGERLGEAYRLYSRADCPASQELAREEGAEIVVQVNGKVRSRLRIIVLSPSRYGALFTGRRSQYRSRMDGSQAA